LYLVPTNALAAQVRRDLGTALTNLEGANVRSFIGGAEYTELAGESVGEVDAGTVMVMTPEKCALALRRSPEAFETLRLCVFDECHLISDGGGRGVIAELVAAHVLAIAPEVRFLLLSAMLEDPGPAADWLQGVTGVQALPVRTPWRPTRTLRGVLGFERDSLHVAAGEARARLSELPSRRVNMDVRSPYAVLVNLQGPWTDLEDPEYALLNLGVNGTLNLRRDGGDDNWRYTVKDDGYLNPTLADVASLLSDRGERVLAFVPRNKHHAFSVADQATGRPTEDWESARALLVDAYLTLASLELGAETPLHQFIHKGVSVHSSALVDAERAASELAFQREMITVLVATGTSAQGLNLPTTAVLVGGTEVGYSPDPIPDAGADSRVRGQLLNAIGRAGRPGVANHGVAIVIPNDAIAFAANDLNTRAALQRAPVLAYEDASVPLTNRLGTLVAAALDGTLVGEAMTTDEMIAFAYLPESTAEGTLGERILQRTFGVWRANPQNTAGTSRTVAHRLQAVGEEFIAAADVPAWTTEVAYRSGITLLDVFALYRATLAVEREEPPADVSGWVGILGDVVRRMPHVRTRSLLFGDTSLAGLRFRELERQQTPSTEAWNSFEDTLRRYLRGQTVSEIAAYATNTDGLVDQGRTVGSKPIPKTLNILQEISYRLSLLAGALAALWALGSEREEQEAGPERRWALTEQQKRSLDLLPLAIRCGADDMGSLAWYRFGLRHRVGAHRLAQSFPLPDDINDDDAISEWIRQTRQRWLDGELQAAATSDQEAEALRRVIRYERV
jgi:hypothetical protein